MTGLEMIAAGGALVAMAVPTMTIFYTFGRLRAKLDTVEAGVKSLQESESKCRQNRERAESELQGRITGVQDRVARVEGRLNGSH